MNHKQKSDSLFKKSHLVFKEDVGRGGGGGGGGASERIEKAKTGRISWQYVKHVKLYCPIYCRFYKENLKIPKEMNLFPHS